MNMILSPTPVDALTRAKADMMIKIATMRKKAFDQLLEQCVPGWIQWFMGKSERRQILVAKIFGIYLLIFPVSRLESDVVSEELIVMRWTKPIGRRYFRIQDKRRLRS